MISYIIGKVISINKCSITLENNYIGYCIMVPNPSAYTVGKISKLYIYKNLFMNNKNKVVEELYGFEEYSTKEFFLSLLKIHGIGVKIAIAICNNDTKLLSLFIHNKSYDSLITMKNITPKIAHILLDNMEVDKNENTEYDNETNKRISEIIVALKNIGYTSNEIENAIKNIDITNTSLELSDLIASAIRYIAQGGSGDKLSSI